MATALLLVFLIDVITVINSLYTFQSVGNNLLFTLNKGLKKVTICSNDITEIKHALPGLINRSSPVKETKRGVIFFKVSKAGNRVVVMTARLIELTNKVGNSITYLNTYHNQTGSPGLPGCLTPSIVTNQFIHSGKLISRINQFFYEENIKLSFMPPCNHRVDKMR
ncbi:hypothetical protein [Mucilaginibacter gotjawali]|uniref:Uncharacterized protein n=2 Tax=Mucilaginibacter gotjawali TaxID=1550579 RepID=A0A839SB12_9SPHI|nr:hypothetical protein [Mucilaginibacter gotjawali]MBB3053777.1 hypothetical protein [Mucilaginibacter gotjawali]